MVLHNQPFHGGSSLTSSSFCTCCLHFNHAYAGPSSSVLLTNQACCPSRPFCRPNPSAWSVLPPGIPVVWSLTLHFTSMSPSLIIPSKIVVLILHSLPHFFPYHLSPSNKDKLCTMFIWLFSPTRSVWLIRARSIVCFVWGYMKVFYPDSSFGPEAWSSYFQTPNLQDPTL